MRIQDSFVIPIVLTSSLFLCCNTKNIAQPLNDIVNRKLMEERVPLSYPAVDERDISWEKRVERVIDLREKMNLYFVAPQSNFIEVLFEGIASGDLQSYSTEGKLFEAEMSSTEMEQIVYKSDTISVSNIETGELEMKVVSDDINYEDFKQIRLSEIWYFNSKTSTLHVRIIGIAPIQEVTDDFGNVKYDRPLFWIHYPSARKYLSNVQVTHPDLVNQMVSYEDQLERRFFSSTIYSVSNVRGDRLKDRYTGLELLQQAEKENKQIFNFEHDLWSY